jgi:hypothetical protein
MFGLAEHHRVVKHLESATFGREHSGAVPEVEVIKIFKGVAVKVVVDLGAVVSWKAKEFSTN